MFDVITIGSATLDAFIETDSAIIVSTMTKDKKAEFMSYPYGAKIDIDNFDFKTGGGAINAATNLSSLGLKTSTIVKVGKEFQAQNIIKTLNTFNVDTSNIVSCDEYRTGFSIILTSFQGDRTVLAHRGANANLKEEDINYEAIKNSKWLYLAPLNGNSTKALDAIAFFAEENNVNLAINIGTSSIKQGKENLIEVLKTAEVIILNKEEATMLTDIHVRPDTKEEKFSKEIIHPDVIKMLKELNFGENRITIITDGKRGAYAYDSKKFYHCGEFPATVVSTLGAGDAFASTFVATIHKYNDIIKALKYASVNAASVVEHFGAQDGFLPFEEIENRLNNSNFEVSIVE